MNIKSILTSFFVLIFSASFAQEAEIKANFTSYLQTLIEKDFEKSMDYISEEFFEIVPRDQMVQLMERTFSNPDMVFEIKDTNILSVGESEEIKSKYYAPLTYSNILRMKFIFDEEQESKEQKDLRLTLTKQSLEEMFGAENVKYEEETGFYSIYSEKLVYAISANGQTDWKFIVIEKQQRPILEKILPEQIIAEIYP